ncbi:unnamed protein product [Peniophora sp. CBMAI 1063]|nr:unnamed protein product [Peniophora sp. CBMAI 1063]
MDYLSMPAIRADEKSVGKDNDANLPSPVVSTERRRPNRLPIALACASVVFALFFVGRRCGWHLPAQQEISPPSELASVDEQAIEVEPLRVPPAEPVPGAVVDISRSVWRGSIFFDGAYINPTDESCLSAWDPTSHEPSRIVTPMGLRRFHATSQFTLRHDVHKYVVDSDIYMDSPGMQLHVVSGSEGQTTVSIDAFYDDPDALSPFSACTYRADETEEILSQQRMFVESNGTTTTQTLEYDPDALQKSDVFRLHRRETNDTEREASKDIWFNITLSIPSGDRAYALRTDGYDVDLYAGVVLGNVMLGGGRITAQAGFMARQLNLNSRDGGKHDGVFGHFSSSGNVSITGIHAPIDARVEITHSLDHQVQTVSIFTYGSSSKTSLLFIGPSRKEEHNSFKVDARSLEGSLDLAIEDGSTYATVTIDAEARNGPAHLSLDSAFEGTFVAKTIDSDESEAAGASYSYAELYPGRVRVYQRPLRTRHIHAGAVAWGSEDAAASASSYAEIRSHQRSAMIDV